MNGRVLAKLGDITLEDVDAIVNAANPTLLGGGGVDGAIHRAGGPAIMEECRALRSTRFPAGLPRGRAVITTGGDLKARHVIHTVGPIWDDSAEDEMDALLGDCYTESLKLARDEGLTSVAFPAISTGVYAFPRERAAHVSSRAVGAFLAADTALSRVVFVFFGEQDLHVFMRHCAFPSGNPRS